MLVFHSRSGFPLDVGLGFIMDSVSSGTLGNVLPGSLLGPVIGLTFSNDGGLLFACSGSSLWVYDVRSGALLSTVRVFMPGVTVYGMDVGRKSCECLGVAGSFVWMGTTTML